MEPTVPLFKQTRHTTDLKTGKLYSLKWVKEKSPSFALQYALVKKQPSGYDIYGVFDTASEAFSARRQWVKENGDSKVFIRATPAAPKQPQQQVYEADDIDVLRDCARDGNEPPEHLRAEFNAYLAKRRNIRRFSHF